MKLFVTNFNRSYRAKEKDKEEYQCYNMEIVKKLEIQLGLSFGKNGQLADFLDAIRNYQFKSKNYAYMVLTDNMILLRISRKTIFGKRYRYPVAFVVDRPTGMWKDSFTLSHIIVNSHYFRTKQQVRFLKNLADALPLSNVVDVRSLM